MSTDFPASLDTLSNPSATTKENVLSHSAQHANENDAIEALEAKVGVNSSAVATTLDYLLKNSASSDPGHTHTLASGTTGTLTVSRGGTGATTLTANGVLIGNGTSAVTATVTPSLTSMTLTGATSLTLGTASSLTGAIVFRNSTNANTFTLQSGATGGALTFTLPTADSSGTQYLQSNGSGTLSWSTPAGTGANTALSNLAAVALNTALLPDAAAADDFGSATLPFKEIYIAGTSGTPGTNNFKITGASTSGTRTFTLPNASGTAALTADKLSAFAATTSAELAGVISDETGSGLLVFATSPVLTTPNIGAATATSVNKVAITTPATSATLTIVDGGSLITAGAYVTTLTSTAATNVTLPTTGTLATLAGTETLSGKTLTQPKIVSGGYIADANGNEQIIFTTTASAVNEITYANAATATNPTITASGETNVGLTITGKGTKGVEIGNALLKKVSALTDGANIATDASLGNIFTVTLGGNRTMDNPTNPISGQTILYKIKQDGSGSRTIAWGAAFRGSTDVALPTLTTTANAVDYVLFFYNTAASTWDCLAVNKGFAS